LKFTEIQNKTNKQ